MAKWTCTDNGFDGPLPNYENCLTLWLSGIEDEIGKVGFDRFQIIPITVQLNSKIFEQNFTIFYLSAHRRS
jgi:hypothetical protein